MQNFLLTFTCLLAFSALATNYPALKDHSIATDAVAFTKRSDFSTSNSTYLIDGEIKSLSIERTTFDRTLHSSTRVKSNIAASDKMGFRWVFPFEGNRRVREGKSEPRKITKESWGQAQPRIEFTYYTQNALEVFLGLNYLVITPYQSKSISVGLESTADYSLVNMNWPHLGVVKRGQGFDGGFYFIQGATSERIIKKNNSVESTEFELKDQIHQPTTIAIFASVRTPSFDIYGEFSAISAGEGGNRTDNGDTVQEDYNIVRLGIDYPLIPSTFILNSIFVYKTLSYADNRTVSLNTVPMTSLHTKAVLGSVTDHVYIGFVYGRSRDGQSLSEFNASYKIDAFGGTIGLNITI